MQNSMTHDILFHGSKAIYFCSEADQFFCRVNRRNYDRLADLVADFPSLLRDLWSYATLINHYHGGAMFSVIRNIKGFQEAYRNAKKFHNFNPETELDEQAFEVGSMHPPRIERDQLVFFAKNKETQQPQRACAPLDPSSDRVVCYESPCYA